MCSIARDLFLDRVQKPGERAKFFSVNLVIFIGIGGCLKGVATLIPTMKLRSYNCSALVYYLAPSGLDLPSVECIELR